jgi:hypothetical protein
MLRQAAKQVASLQLRTLAGFSVGEGAEFLEMVEKYFDKAGAHTKIRPDILNFYKKADNVVKFNLTLIRGKFPPTQMTIASRSSRPTAASIRPTNCPPRAAPATPRMWTSLRWRPWPA